MILKQTTITFWALSFKKKQTLTVCFFFIYTKCSILSNQKIFFLPFFGFFRIYFIIYATTKIQLSRLRVFSSGRSLNYAFCTDTSNVQVNNNRSVRRLFLLQFLIEYEVLTFICCSSDFFSTSRQTSQNYQKYCIVFLARH